MVKFATALCFLVAVTGIQGRTMQSSIISTMSAEVEEGITKIEEYQTKIASFLETIETSASSEISAANKTLISAINEYQDELNSAMATVSADVSSCETSWSNEKTKGETILAQATTCIQKVLAEANTNYNTYKSELSGYSDAATNFLDQVSDCSDDSIFTFLGCSAKITWTFSSNLKSWATLAANIVSFIDDQAKFTSEFTACSDTSGVAAYVTALKASYQTAVECVEAAASNS